MSPQKLAGFANKYGRIAGDEVGQCVIAKECGLNR